MTWRLLVIWIHYTTLMIQLRIKCNRLQHQFTLQEKTTSKCWITHELFTLQTSPRNSTTSIVCLRKTLAKNISSDSVRFLYPGSNPEPLLVLGCLLLWRCWPFSSSFLLFVFVCLLILWWRYACSMFLMLFLLCWCCVHKIVVSFLLLFSARHELVTMLL